MASRQETPLHRRAGDAAQLRFNAMQLMGAIGVGIAAGAGTGIVTGLVGTAIV